MNHLEEVRRPLSLEYGATGGSLHNQATADSLSRLAHAKVLAALKGYGNHISPTHDQALLELSQALSRQALRIRPGRFAYAMPCGAGKTQSVVAWIAAAHELGLGLSVAVSAFQIGALCSIKLGLMAAGVPESKIGLRHSLGIGVKLPDTGEDDRPIMLVSHARIRGQRESSAFTLHQGRKRDVLIWDESLMTADAQMLSWLDVKLSIERVLPELPRDSSLAHGLSSALLTMQSDLDSQRDGGAPKPIVLFDVVKLDEIQEEARKLRSWGTANRSVAVKTVKMLTKMAAQPMSLALTGNGASGEGLIRYTVAVPVELDNIAILDASYPIRELTHGQSIADGTSPAMKSCKRYDRVSVRQISMATGRTTLQQKPTRLKDMAAKLAQCIDSVPAQDSILIFTFKGDDNETMLGKVRREVAEHGIDLEALLDGGQPRISWLTWGNETSLSEYQHCKHIILAGVLRRSPLDLLASAAGREDDLCYRLTTQQLKDIQLSEMAHCVLQAMNRGSCRSVDREGKAHAMTLTILADVKGLHEALADSL